MRLAIAIFVVLVPRLVTADVNISPSNVTCPATSVGVESAAASVTLTRISGSNTANLSIGNCSGAGSGTFNFPAQVNLSALVDISYIPASAGSRNCTISVTNGAGNPSTFVVNGNGVVPPMISVTTPSNFGAVRFLDSAVGPHLATRTVTVENDGGSVLNVTNVTLTGDFSIDPASPNGTTATINGGGGTKNWTIRFNPSAPGSRTGMLTFDSNAGQRTVPLAGDGTTGSYTIAATGNGNFGTVAAGTSAGLDITVTHDGGPPKGVLTFSAATVTNATAPWFTIVAQPTALSSTTTTGTITVRCSPPSGASTTQTATINISADADAGAMKTQNVSCQGGASILALDTSVIDMDPTLVNTVSATKTVVVVNTGTSNASVGFSSASTNAARFSVSGPAGCGVGANNCVVAMGGGMITVTMSFSPDAEGTVSASFNINGAGAAPSFVVSGRGIDRHIQVPESVQFPDTFRNPGSKAMSVPVTVENKGEYPITVSGYQVGAGSEVWSVDESMTQFPLTVPGLSTADVMVKFEPKEAGKATDGQLLLMNDDMKVANGMPIVILSGNGKNRNVDLLPGGLDLGERAVGVPAVLSIARPSDVLTLVNKEMVGDPTADFTIRGLDVDGLGLVVEPVGNVVDTTLAAGESRMLDIRVTATQPGDLTGNVVVFLDEDPEPAASVVVHLNAVTVDIHGGGGCSTGTGAGPLALLALAGLRRRRRG